jgi:hypothetical protein
MMADHVRRVDDARPMTERVSARRHEWLREMPRVTQRIAADTGYSPHSTPARVVERDRAPEHDDRSIRAVLATAVTTPLYAQVRRRQSCVS